MTTTKTPAEVIAAVRGRLEAATPWEVEINEPDTSPLPPKSEMESRLLVIITRIAAPEATITDQDGAGNVAEFVCADDARGVVQAREDLATLCTLAETAIRERDEARETIKRLNRRCTAAEGHVKTTIEDCQRQGVSVGRGLANAGYRLLQQERDAALARVERLEQILEAMDAARAALRGEG